MSFFFYDVCETSMISGVRCLACRVGSLSFGLRLLLGEPVGLVPGLIASETNDYRSLSISFLHQRLVGVFTILGLFFLISVVGELVASFTDVPAWLDGAKAELFHGGSCGTLLGF